MSTLIEHGAGEHPGADYDALIADQVVGTIVYEDPDLVDAGHPGHPRRRRG
ncbi:hypothetical protein Misp01_66340 [Microtetraspora sp. NBRC 13810]|nr:hypothetical protein Misp01_66340 [Microtetraspora sp. NBRC 13810]